MNQPWDRPPFPKRGNASRNVLFESIGRALMAWEDIERSFAYFYAAFSGVSRYDREANEAYGVAGQEDEPGKFVQRLDALKKKGNAFFVKHPNQAREGQFQEIRTLARSYSPRRNDIAHGRVHLVHWHLNPSSRATILTGAPLEWGLVPQHFVAKRFTKANMPIYVLTSREINRFAAAFYEIAHQGFTLARAIDRAPVPLPPTREGQGSLLGQAQSHNR